MVKMQLMEKVKGIFMHTYDKYVVDEEFKPQYNYPAIAFLPL
jgi:hypothetical protein